MGWVLIVRYGFAAEKQLNWAVGFIGYGFIVFGLGSAPTVTLTYRTLPPLPPPPHPHTHTPYSPFLSVLRFFMRSNNSNRLLLPHLRRTNAPDHRPQKHLQLRLCLRRDPLGHFCGIHHGVRNDGRDSLWVVAFWDSVVVLWETD